MRLLPACYLPQVQGADPAAKSAWIAEEPDAWQLLGDACARLAAEDAAALPALLAAAFSLTERCGLLSH